MVAPGPAVLLCEYVSAAGRVGVGDEVVRSIVILSSSRVQLIRRKDVFLCDLDS